MGTVEEILLFLGLLLFCFGVVLMIKVILDDDWR